MKIKAVLFDMDGVLVESEPYILQAAIKALGEFGIKTEPSDYTEFIGAGEDKFVGGTAMKKGFAYDPQMKQRAYDIYGELVKNAGIASPGVKDILDKLKVQGYLIAVCSSADRIKVGYNLDSMGVAFSFFDYVITGSEVERKKPHPDIYLAAAKALDIPVGNCIVVEDAINGIQAAKAAGMRNVAVTTHFTDTQLKNEADPDYIIAGVHELFSVLDNLSV